MLICDNGTIREATAEEEAMFASVISPEEGATLEAKAEAYDILMGVTE